MRPASTRSFASGRTVRSRRCEQLIERLGQTPTPKTVVYVSEGLVLDRLSDDHMAWPHGGARPRHNPRAAARGAHRRRLGGARSGDAGARSIALARRSRLAGRQHARRHLSDCRRSRYRLQPPRARALGLLPSQLRARGHRPRRKAAQDQGRRARKDGARDPRARRVRRSPPAAHRGRTTSCSPRC